jgi:hypothetical protein
MTNIYDNSIWIIGDGTKINYWTDNWLGETLAEALNLPLALHKNLKNKVCDVIVDHHWQIPTIIHELAPWIVNEIYDVTLPLTITDDVLVWKNSKDGTLSAKDAYCHLFPHPDKLHWASIIWQNFIPPSSTFVFWRFIHNKVPTDYNLRARGCTIVSICSLCGKAYETSNHLFLSCQFAQGVWKYVACMLDCSIDLS